MADDKKKAEETHGYRLRPGKKHVQNGEELKAGDVVQLGAVQVKAFADKFESIDHPDERVAGVPIKPAPNPGTPQDISGRSPDPSKGQPSGGPTHVPPGTVVTEKK